MQTLINMPTCEAGHGFLQEMLVPQPVMWLAGCLLIAAVVLLSNRSARAKLVGQALLFGGMLLGAVPAMNRMLLAAIDCSQPEQLARLSDAMPVANGLAGLIMVACVAGVARSLWLLKTAPAKTAAT